MTLIDLSEDQIKTVVNALFSAVEEIGSEAEANARIDGTYIDVDGYFPEGSAARELQDSAAKYDALLIVLQPHIGPDAMFAPRAKVWVHTSPYNEVALFESEDAAERYIDAGHSSHHAFPIFDQEVDR